MKSAKKEEREAKWAEEREAANLKAMAEREAHKLFVRNLHKWRVGQIDAFLIRTYQQYAGEHGYNTNPWDVESEMVFRIDEATKRFNELNGSREPDNNGIEFVCELLNLLIRNEDITDRLQVVNENDLLIYISDNCDSIRCETYAPVIPEGHVIITIYHRQHGSSGNFHDAHYPVKHPFWMGDRRVEAEITTADLLAFRDVSPSYYEITLPIAEAIEDYRESIIEKLDINKAQAIEAGVNELLIQELFPDEEQDDE